MKSVHVIGQRNLDPARAADDKIFDIVVAEKQKTRSPSGKLETVIVFRRVSRDMLDQDGSGKTLKDAKRAVSMIKDHLTAKGLSAKQVKNLLDHMYTLSSKDNLSRDKRALEARALDRLVHAGQFATRKTRFDEGVAVIPQKPRPLPTQIDLPELPPEE